MQRISLSMTILVSAFMWSACSNGKKPAAKGIGTVNNATEEDQEGDLEKAPGQKPDNIEKTGPTGALGSGEEADPGETSTTPTIIACSALDTARTYKGFGGVDLKAGRVEKMAPLGDRYRIKPFPALSTEITRVFNNVAPASLAKSAPTFPTSAPRWFVEPIASGITLFTTYRIAYDGGLTVSGSHPDMRAAPTPETAEKICGEFMNLAWRRPGTPAEVEHCKNVAIMATAAETDVKVRWAHTIASILTSADFIAY